MVSVAMHLLLVALFVALSYANDVEADSNGDWLLQSKRTQNGTATSRQATQCNFYTNIQAGSFVTFSSRQYPYNYPPFEDCAWYADSPPGTHLELECNDFSVEQSPGCNKDRFLVSRTGDVNLADAHIYCSYGIVRETSITNKINIGFVSDGTDPPNTLLRFNCSLSAKVNVPVTTAPPVITTPPPTGCNCGIPNNQMRIVGGQETAVNEFPWMCAIFDAGGQFCGATLLSSGTALTAAHCVDGKTPKEIALDCGDHNLVSGSDTTYNNYSLVSRITMHPLYNNVTQLNDIAVLSLRAPVKYTKGVRPVCLPSKFRLRDFTGETATALGWGTTSFGGPLSDTLMKVNLPIISTARCATQLPGYVTDNSLCTFKNGSDACQADSGGPLQWRNVNNGRIYQLGVISFGVGCASNKPGVYTRVTNYIDWITLVTGETYCTP